MQEDEKRRIESELLHAKDFFEDYGTHSSVLTGGLELVYAREGARIADDVGHCILKLSGCSTAEDRYDEWSSVSFGVLSPLTTAVLTAMRFSPDVRAALSIRYTPEVIDACNEMLLLVCEPDATKIPTGVSTMDWAVAFCSEQEDGVPDVLCIKNSNSLECSVKLFGETPLKVTTNVINISKRIIDANSRE